MFTVHRLLGPESQASTPAHATPPQGTAYVHHFLDPIPAPLPNPTASPVHRQRPRQREQLRGRVLGDPVYPHIPLLVRRPQRRAFAHIGLADG
jgi:hypothetical protein